MKSTKKLAGRKLTPAEAHAAIDAYKSGNSPSTPRRARTKVLARVMWSSEDRTHMTSFSGGMERIVGNCGTIVPMREPVSVLPRSAASDAAMIEQGARAMYVNERRHEPHKMTWETTWEAVRRGYRKDARAVLRSLGLLTEGKG